MYYVHLVVVERDGKRTCEGLDHSSCLRQVHPEPSLGTDPVGGGTHLHGKVLPIQAVLRTCIQHLGPVQVQLYGPVLGGQSSSSNCDLVSQPHLHWRAQEGAESSHPPSLASASHSSQLHLGKTFAPTSHPSCALGLEGGDERGGPAPGLSCPLTGLPVCLSLCAHTTAPNMKLGGFLSCSNPFRDALAFSGDCPNSSALGDLSLGPALLTLGWLSPSQLHSLSSIRTKPRAVP